MSIKHRCFCGSTTFSLFIDEDHKGRATIVCEVCQCRRTIRTPGTACVYEMHPPTVEAHLTVRDPITGILESSKPA